MNWPPFRSVRLETARLLLRPFVPEDAATLFAIYSDPRVIRYWSSPGWTGIEQAHALIDDDLDGMERNTHLRLGVVRWDTGELIGQCVLYAFMRQCRRAEIGYLLHADHWKQGFMHEALTALLDFAFGTLDLHRIEADVDPRNQASVRTMERLGFQKEGYLRERWIVAGEISDTQFFGLLAREWNASRAQP